MFASTRHTGNPESYYHGEGRVALTGDKPAFQYKLTDHLGNTMVLFEDKDGDKIITTESMSPLAQYQQSLVNRASEIRSYFETLPKRKDE